MTIKKELNLACVQHTDAEKNRINIFLRKLDEISDETLVYIDFGQVKPECRKKLGRYTFCATNYIIHRSWIGGYIERVV